MSTFSIEIQPKALTHLEKQLAQHTGATLLLLELKPDGCSGYQFYLTPQQTLPANAEQVAPIICINKAQLAELSGLVIDVEAQGHFGFKLTYTLPHAHSYCGCGKSFKLDAQEGTK